MKNRAGTVRNMIAAWSRSLPRKRKISLRTDAASSREDATQGVNTGAEFLNCGLQKLRIYFCKAVLKLFDSFFSWRFWTQPLRWLPHMDYTIFTRDHIYLCFAEGYHLNKPQALMRLSSCTAWSSWSCVLVQLSGFWRSAYDRRMFHCAVQWAGFMMWQNWQTHVRYSYFQSRKFDSLVFTLAATRLWL